MDRVIELKRKVRDEMNQGNKIGVDAVVKKEIDEMNQEIEGQKKKDTNQELITPKQNTDENHSNSDSNLSETNKITKSDPIVKTLSYTNLMEISSYKCICDSGYVGSDCSVKKCPSDCGINGKCSFADPENPICICNKGYEGDACQNKSCLNNCSSNGDCDHLTGQCTCNKF